MLTCPVMFLGLFPSSPGRSQSPSVAQKALGDPAPPLPDLSPSQFSATLASSLFFGYLHHSAHDMLISLHVATFLQITIRPGPHLFLVFAQTLPSQWYLS